jgi:predicted metal-dependent phosphoesterase TrpH/glycosyltransferase involved in cell wall biosynthesis
VPSGPRAIAQVTPFPWEDGHEVNLHVERVSAQLAARGHAVVVVAPSRSPELVHRGRRAVHDGIVPAWGEVRVVAVAEAIGAPLGAARRPSLPIDVSRTVEQLLTDTPFDICHVHEPWAPSVASVALRHSRSLNVGTFHAPAERLIATQVTRKLVELVFGRLDARLASFEATRDLLARAFPAEYRVVLPGADVSDAPDGATDDAEGPIRIGFADDEERGALRLFLRALRHLDERLPWEVVVRTTRGESTSIPMRAALRERVTFVTDGDAFAGADIAVAGSDSARPAPGMLLRAIGAGAVVLAPSLAVYEEVLGDGERGLLFAADDAQTLAAQLERLILDAPLRARLRDAAAPLREALRWEHVAQELGEIYDQVLERRHATWGDPIVRRRLERRRLIDVDLHMHTDHSNDCATPVEVLLATAREQGLGAIAVTDHNEVSGAHDARAKAAEYGVKVIVAEEVKTADQGEVIGLFIEERIPRGMSLEQTVAEIKRQGGLVYVPHPFDRMHAVPDYEHLLKIVGEIDAIEIYNPRVAIGSFNEEAARFATKYRILAGAGSDAHVAQGLGSVRVRMHDFDGPDEFLESLRSAEIHTKPASLLYVQALKFLQTKATPPAARKASRERRVRRATRKA